MAARNNNKKSKSKPITTNAARSGTPAPAPANPVDSAWRWLQSELGGAPVPPLLALIGLGDGTLLEALERHAPETRVLALEPDPALVPVFKARRNWERWFSTGRLAYLADPDYAGADEAWRVFPAGVETPTVLVHPQLRLTPAVARATEVLKKILYGVQSNANARKRFAPRYLVNSLRNLPRIVAGHDVRDLQDAYRGVPAIIAGAGPSLDHAIPELRGAHERALIVATDTALRPLLLGGVKPQLVVAADPSTANARHLLSLPPCDDTWLVSESALDPSATEVFADRTFWFRLAKHHPWPWFQELGVDVGLVEMWGSVLTAAFQVACLAGCEPIVIVGGDLAYTNDRPYARGTTYELDWAAFTACGTPLDAVWHKRVTKGNVLRLPDLTGRETATTASFISYRDWLVSRAQRNGRRVVNATGAGMLFGEGLEQGALSDGFSTTVPMTPVSTLARPRSGAAQRVMAARLRELRAAMGVAAPAPGPSPVAPTTVADRLEAAPRSFSLDATLGSTLSEWMKFSGEGFDAAKVRAALEEAATAMEAERKRPASATDSWRALAASVTTLGIVMRLPEAIARLRAGLNGVTPLPEGGADLGDSGTLLADALVLLEWIAYTSARAEDVVPARKVARKGHLPISVSYAWPEATKWAVQVFEALLGCVWTAPMHASYAVRPVVRRPSVDAITNAGALRPHAKRACTSLLMQWLRAAASLQHEGRLPPGSSAVHPPVTLCAEVFDEVALARVLTGNVRRSVEETQSAAIVETPVQQLMLRLAPFPSARDHKSPEADSGLYVRPRVLTDEGLPYASIAYAGPDGAVCARYHEDTILIGENGSSALHNRWPHKVISELPWGVEGTVAWGDDPDVLHDGDVAYVMFKASRDAAVRVDRLPIRPSCGTWMGDRLYWGTFPKTAGGWTGVASWAPGHALKRETELPFPLFDIRPTDNGFVLEPCGVSPGHQWERRLMHQGWTWTPSQEPVATPLDALGATSSRATSGGWTAVAYPEADVVRLIADDGRMFMMTCYYPLKLAWIGRSLLVSTMKRELLLFEQLVDILETPR